MAKFNPGVSDLTVAAGVAPDTSSNCVLAYQPIIDVDRHSVAVELLYPPTQIFGVVEDAETVTARLVIDTFIHSGLDAFTRDRRVFLSLPPSLLGSDLLGFLPAQHFSLIVNISSYELPVERCRALRDAGFSIILAGGEAAGNRLAALLSCADAVRFSAEEALAPANESLIRDLRIRAVRMMATNVDRLDQFNILREKGFQLFQGYYFAHRAEATGTRVNPRQMAVLDILSRVSSNAEEREIEAAFRVDMALTLDLLRLVNSSAMAPHMRISSIRQALTVLGRDQLRRWLQILLFSLDTGDHRQSPLMDLALRRGAFMEQTVLLHENTDPARFRDTAFMVGMLSLADVLLRWPMTKVVDRLGLADEISKPLLVRQGICGLLLTLCETLEAGDFNGAALLAEELGLPMSAVMQAQGEALAWASQVASGQEGEAESGQYS